MTEIPADAPRSPDGVYWWDGTAWQEIPEHQRHTAAAAGSSAAAGAAAASASDFRTSFAQALGQYGVHVDAGSLPDEATLQAGVQGLESWFSGLDQSLQAGFDAATTDDPVSVLLGHHVAPTIVPLLQAFDATAGVPLSHLIAYSTQALAAAAQH